MTRSIKQYVAGFPSDVQNKPRLLFVGECRSLTAQSKGWTWKDGRLAAKPLFEALAAMGVDAAAHEFTNLWSDNATGQTPGESGIAIIAWQKIDRLKTRAKTGVIVALGKRVSAELTKRGIAHVALVHPAARGKIRKRERYHEHVKTTLGPAISSPVTLEAGLIPDAIAIARKAPKIRSAGRLSHLPRSTRR